MKIMPSLAIVALCFCSIVLAAPDEQKLGRDAGYPIGTANRKSFLDDESMRVGSFTHHGEIAGLYNGKANTLKRADRAMPLPKAPVEADYRWRIDQQQNLGVDDYLARQRIMGLMVVKDGVIQLERYQYERTPSHRFTSHSMAKSITSLGVGIALNEGKIKSLDDRADSYAHKLKGTLLGETTIRNLLRMASGIRNIQTYDGTGDSGRFDTALSREGVEAAAAVLTVRERQQGVQFSYSSAQSATLGAVLRAATGMNVSDYLTPRLWQAIGAEQSALWRADKAGLEVTYGNFNAILRDYARLGVVLANDGVRPDDPSGKPIIPQEFLLDATDWKRAPEQFRPGKATPHMGYGYQFWILPGERRQFAMLGVYGQSIFIDPALKLVVVQTGVNATAEAGDTSLARERLAFWRGVLAQYERKNK
jgi:CubicO group peptidase (beta-lactamase class C family)